MFDGLDDDDAPRRPGSLFVIGVTIAITVLALVAWAIAAFVRSFDFCPDGGDEIWHHPPRPPT